MATGTWALRAVGWAETLALPAAVGLSLAQPALRERVAERLAWRLPAVEPGAIWIHAASLGEGQAAAALAQGIAARWPDLPVLRTATSEAGRAQELPVDARACLPLDAVPLCARFVRRVRPRALILVEGELWPGLLAACSGRIPIAAVGLRAGRGVRRLAALAPPLLRALVGAIDHATACAPADADWFGAWFGRELPVTGDLKAEASVDPGRLALPAPLLIAGSTRPGDEAAVLAAWRTLAPRPFLVLAPRHAERFGEVAALLDAGGLRWERRSALGAARPAQGTEVLLLDTLGELAGLYPLARAAFVGGTFDPALGGHSPSEAARVGVPVAHGPETWASEASFTGLARFRAARPEDLAAALAAALAAPCGSPAGGEAVARTLDLLAPLAAAPVPAERAHRPLAWPLVPAVRAITAIQSGLRRPRRGPLPVLCVGNLASGGTGKTQVVRWLVARLAARGLRPAVLARGCGRDPGPALVDTAGGPRTAARLGDEQAMLAADGTLAVSSGDRLRGAHRAAALGADLCVLDDGLQQRHLAWDAAIAVLDARAPLSGGPLPVGTAREPPAVLRRADVVWSNHGPLAAALRGTLAADAVVVEARCEPQGWVCDGRLLPLADGPRGRVGVLANLASPAGLLRTLRRLGLVPARCWLGRDHAAWDAGALARIRGEAGELPLVTTEKDLARLPPGFPATALRVALVPTAGEAAFERFLDRFLAQHGLQDAGGVR